MSRIDLDIYNEATGFMITSKCLCGRDFSDIDPDEPEWLDAIKEGIFLPFELVQDDSFIIRVVLDEELSPQEQEEWVASSAHKLRIPDGKLAIIGGGVEYLWGEDMDEFSRFLEVPRGDYLAEVYTYFHGANGSYCLNEIDPNEPIGAYFRHTRPGQAFPLWLRNECAEDPDLDPGHQSEWEGVEVDYDTVQPPYLGFLVRLSPLVRRPGIPAMEDGWFEASNGARKPTACPQGIVAEYLKPAED